MKPAARLWFGRTVHVREKPFRRAFSHRVAMIDVDIDRLLEADRLSRFLSVNRGNAISLRETDYGARDVAVPLRAWAEGRYAEAGIDLQGGSIRLVTFPRVLGYGFAPISLWYGYGLDGVVRGVIYEVHNTFGEAHAYVSALGRADVRDKADKELHVSPFFDVSGEYRFTLKPSEERMALTVENLAADGRHHVASLNLRATALTTPAILKWLVTMPISGVGVMVAIHWQAFRLWLKGARYRDKPAQRATRTTLARPEETFATATKDLRKRA